MKKLNEQKGFTLVELLLVIAIIGILATVLFVSLGKQRQRARMTTFKENMRGLVTAATACHDAGETILGTTTTPYSMTNVKDAQADVCGGGNFGKVPYQQACQGGSGFAKIQITSGDSDDWVLNGCCPLSSGGCSTMDSADDCTATCTANGCEYANCE